MVEEDNHSEFTSFKGSAMGKKYREPKAYVNRLKRHQDAILKLHAPTGPDGPLLISGSADEKIRIWDLQTRTISQAISVERPPESVLIKYQSIGQDNLPRFADETPSKKQSIFAIDSNPLSGLPEKKQQQFATCFCFAENYIFVSYEDGLITAWEVGTKKFLYPMIGHTNRINALERIEKFLYSSANDCTVRQWDITNGVCVNIYKFADPISVTKVNVET